MITPEGDGEAAQFAKHSQDLVHWIIRLNLLLYNDEFNDLYENFILYLSMRIAESKSYFVSNHLYIDTV